MYKEGDVIVYGNTGVCRIEAVFVPDFEEADRLYYSIRPLYDDCMIYVPVDSKVFMRPVITKEEAESLIDCIPMIKSEAYFAKSVQQLGCHYDSVIKKHDCRDLIELIMSIYAKKQYVLERKQKFGQLDERFMKKAEELLYSEFAAALDIPREEVQPYIEKRVAEIK